MIGAYDFACQRVQGLAAKSPFKESLSKGAYLNVLVFLCSSTFGHMYTKAGAWSHTSSLVLCLSCCLYCGPCALCTGCLPLFCLVTASVLCCDISSTFHLLRKHLMSLTISRWHTAIRKMTRLANIVLSFASSKAAYGQQIKLVCTFICNISIPLCVVTGHVIREE